MFAFAPSRALPFALLLAAAGGCDGEAGDEQKPQVVCAPTAPTQCPDPPPRYADVAPIFEQRCASCHTGTANAQWPLDSYEHVADWASYIRDELLSCSMPPSDSGVVMTPDERQQILTWIYCGYPE